MSQMTPTAADARQSGHSELRHLGAQRPVWSSEPSGGTRTTKKQPPLTRVTVSTPWERSVSFAGHKVLSIGHSLPYVGYRVRVSLLGAQSTICRLQGSLPVTHSHLCGALGPPPLGTVSPPPSTWSLLQGTKSPSPSTSSSPWSTHGVPTSRGSASLLLRTGPLWTRGHRTHSLDAASPLPSTWSLLQDTGSPSPDEASE